MAGTTMSPMIWWQRRMASQEDHIIDKTKSQCSSQYDLYIILWACNKKKMNNKIPT